MELSDCRCDMESVYVSPISVQIVPQQAHPKKEPNIVQKRNHAERKEKEKGKEKRRDKPKEIKNMRIKIIKQEERNQREKKEIKKRRRREKKRITRKKKEITKETHTRK